MKKWRIILGVVVLLAIVLLLGSELFFDRPFSWFPGREFLSQRHRVFFERVGIRNLTRRLLALFASLLSSFLVGTLVMFALPKRVRHIANCISQHPAKIWRYLGVGLVSIIAFGATAMLSVFSVYTFPASFLIMLVIFIFSALGAVAISFHLGRRLLELAGWSPRSPMISFGLGMFIIFSAIRIPYLGVLFLLLVGFIGFGAALTTRFGSGKNWTLRALVEEEV